MADEKQFILNVRKDILKKPLYKRAKKAISSIREQTGRAMHVNPKNVKICKELNELVRSQGKHNPPTKYKLHATLIDGFTLVELQGVTFPQKKEKKAPEAKGKGLKEKIQEKLAGKESEKKKELQSKETEKDKELAKEQLAMEKKEHHHEHPGAPGKYRTEEDAKKDKIKGTVVWDGKKDIGEK